jgi:ribosomal protein S18 acetylase RimI-like enzyme
LKRPVYELREEAAEDETFLRRLFFANREAEFAPLGLAPAQLFAMLNMQFTAQRSQYRLLYTDCAWRIVEQKGEPIGRLYVARDAAGLHIIDIALLPEFHGQGIGGALLDGVLAQARSEALPVHLTVRHENPARLLYARKGFVETGLNGVDVAMTWKP